jgi:hypothetical protein
VVEHLPGKCKAVGSNPSTAEKKSEGQQACWHTTIPATQEAEKRGSWFEPSLGKKSARLNLKNKSGMVIHICNPSHLGGRRIEV